MIVQSVVIDYFVDFLPIAVWVERRHVYERFEFLEAVHQVDDFFRTKQINVDGIVQQFIEFHWGDHVEHNLVEGKSIQYFVKIMKI